MFEIPEIEIYLYFFLRLLTKGQETRAVKYKMKSQSYRIITTDDSTSSLYSEEYDEVMHSTSGAYEESLFKHVYPSKILEKRNRKIAVLDIGFGLGYNVLALITEFLKNPISQHLNIVSLEKESDYAPHMRKIEFSDERNYIYNKIKQSFFLKQKLITDMYSFEIITGDARNTIKAIKDTTFDAIFHDPYSPSKNPELWSVEIFQEIQRLATDTCILTTYSSAPQIRMALIKAGFRLGKGPSLGKKREGTLATISGGIDFLGATDLNTLENDIKSTPYRDDQLCNSRKKILNQRINEMRVKRSKD
ncbi:MAG: MnmC family methyltransferase [Spirochaetota bacterium]|nr:MnmC family methyltransferase [Spirochaetota bacterium]